MFLTVLWRLQYQGEHYSAHSLISYFSYSDGDFFRYADSIFSDTLRDLEIANTENSRLIVKAICLVGLGYARG